MKNSGTKNIYVAAADILSKTKAYEYAEEFGYEIVGQSGYLNDASNEICSGNVDTIICSQKLFNGYPKQLYNNLPHHIRDKCDFLIISPIKNGTYKLRKMSFNELHTKNGIIEATLDYVQIPKNLKGYALFKEALDMVLATPDALFEITQKVYARLASLHDTDIRSIEFNMRTAKNHSLLHCNPDIISEIFGDYPDEKSISLGLYLSKLTDYILRIK